MGLLSRARTAQRTRDELISTTSGLVAEDTGIDLLEERLRDALCEAGRPGAKSSLTRGRTIRGFEKLGDSSAWYRQVAESTYDLSHGIRSVDGEMLDWRIQVKLLGETGIEVRTVEHLAIDSALANATRHDEVRFRIRNLTGSSNGAAGASASVVNATMPTEVAPAHQRAGFNPTAEFRLYSALDPSAAADVLARVPLPLLRRDADRWVFATSLLMPDDRNSMTVTVLPDRDGSGRLVLQLESRAELLDDVLVDDSIASMSRWCFAWIELMFKARDPNCEAKKVDRP